MRTARSSRLLAALTTLALTVPASALLTSPAASASTVGGQIASIANSQVGDGPCGSSPSYAGYWGGSATSQRNSCAAPGQNAGQSEAWCADFAAWVWNQAGVTLDSSINGYANSFYTYSKETGHSWSTSTPHVGDAVYFDSALYGGHGHVGIVTSVNSDNSFSWVGGNQNGAVGTGSSRPGAFVWNYSDGAAVYVMGFATPAGGTPVVPAGFNVSLAGFSSGQSVSGTVNLNAYASQQGVIEWLDYLITGPNNYRVETRAGGGAQNYPLAVDTTQLAPGTYTVSMIANEIDRQNHTYQGASFSVATTPAPAPASATANTSKGSVLYPNGLAATFKIGSDGSLYNAWQTLPSRTFTSASLGTLGSAGLVGNPTAILDTTGRTSVFARTTSGTIASVWQNSVGGAMNSSVASIAAGSPNFAGDPTAVRYNNGAYGVFAIDTAGDLWTTWQPSAGSGWVDWTDLGNGGTGGLVGNPTAIMNAGGLPSVFARTTSGTIVQVWQPAAGAAMNSWAVPLAAGAPIFDGDPSAVLYNNGAFGVYAVDTAGNLWTTWQPSAGSGWVGWTNLGSGGTGGLVGTPTAVLNANGLASVFTRTSTGVIATVWQNGAGGAMNNWATSIAANSPTFVGDPSALLYPNGAFAAFAVDASGTEWTSWQNSAGSGFTNWVQVQ